MDDIKETARQLIVEKERAAAIGLEMRRQEIQRRIRRDILRNPQNDNSCDFVMGAFCFAFFASCLAIYYLPHTQDVALYASIALVSGCIAVWTPCVCILRQNDRKNRRRVKEAQDKGGDALEKLDGLEECAC